MFPALYRCVDLRFRGRGIIPGAVVNIKQPLTRRSRQVALLKWEGPGALIMHVSLRGPHVQGDDGGSGLYKPWRGSLELNPQTLTFNLSSPLTSNASDYRFLSYTSSKTETHRWLRNRRSKNLSREDVKQKRKIMGRSIFLLAPDDDKLRPHPQTYFKIQMFNFLLMWAEQILGGIFQIHFKLQDICQNSVCWNSMFFPDPQTWFSSQLNYPSGVENIYKTRRTDNNRALAISPAHHLKYT